PTDTLRGHTDIVNVLDFSPDGRILASGSDDEMVRLWDMQTYQPIGSPLDQHLGSVQALAWSPDGSRLASGAQPSPGGDNSENLIIWDLATHKQLGDPLVAHTGSVMGLTYSSTGDSLFSCSSDNTVIVWDLNQYKVAARFRGHRDQVNAIAVSPDGTQLVSTGWDNNIIVWNLANPNLLGKQIATLAFPPMSLRYLKDRQALMAVDGGGNINFYKDTGRQGSISLQTGVPVASPICVAVSHPLHILAEGDANGAVTFWDLATGQKLGPPVAAHKKKITYMAMNRAGTMLATGGPDGFLYLWDVARRIVISPPLKARLGEVYDIAFSPDGSTVAVSYDQNAIALWDAGRFQLKAPLINLNVSASCIAFTPDGRFLAIGSGYGSAKKVVLTDLRDPGSGTDLWPEDEEGSRLIKLAFSPNGKFLAAGTSTGKITVFDMAKRQVFKKPVTVNDAGIIYGLCFDPGSRQLVIGTEKKGVYTWEMGQPVPSAHFATTRAAVDLAFTDESRVAAVLRDSTVVVLDAKSLRLQPVLNDPHNEVMTCISLSPDNKTVVLGRDRGDILYWQESADHRQTIRALPVRFQRGIKDLVIIDASNTLVLAVKDSTIHFLDVRTGAALHPPLPMGDEITFMTLSHDERIMAVGKNSGSIVLLDAKTFKPLGPSLEGHARTINFLRFSPDDRHLASASYDRMVYIWDVKAGKASGLPFMAHQGQVLTLAFSADGRMLASAGSDNYINLWDIPGHTRFGAAFQSGSAVRRLAFSADGQYLYSAGDDKRVMRWTLDPQDWLNDAEQIANN
ncbi:MAG TPA: hypothetical protein VGM89_17820, partial [Puia sp.]